MNIKELHTLAYIKNEPGILTKKGGGIHTPSAFSTKHLFYCSWTEEYLCNSNYHVKRSYLDSFALFQILQGDMEFAYAGKNFTGHEGNIVMLDLRNPHNYHACSRVKVRQYLLGGSATKAYYDLITSEYGFLYTAKGAISSILNQLFSELSEPFPNDHRASWLIHEFFGLLYTQETPALSASVLMASEYIQNHFSDDITVEKVAKEVSLSKGHLTRLFNKELHLSPHEFILTMRMKYAMNLLLETTMPVEAIAFQSGFHSSTHFIRAFRTRMDTTPTKFRKSFRPYD